MPGILILPIADAIDMETPCFVKNEEIKTTCPFCGENTYIMKSRLIGFWNENEKYTCRACGKGGTICFTRGKK